MQAWTRLLFRIHQVDVVHICLLKATEETGVRMRQCQRGSSHHLAFSSFLAFGSFFVHLVYLVEIDYFFKGNVLKRLVCSEGLVIVKQHFLIEEDGTTLPRGRIQPRTRE
jgi:hypothetical protein